MPKRVYVELPEPEYPARLVLELCDQQLVFVHVAEDCYAAELEGKRQLIRKVHEWSMVSEAGRDPYEPKRSEGDTANIDTILQGLALGAVRKPLAHGVELSTMHQWGHFRQNTFLMVSITIAEGGAVEINEDIRVQDGSYY